MSRARGCRRPHGDGRAWTYRARQPDRDPAAEPRRRRRGRQPRPGGARRRTCPRTGVTVVLLRAAVARGRPQGRPAAGDPRRRAARRRRRGCGPPPRWSSAAAPPAPGRRPAARRGLGAAGCLALAFPLHPPGQAGEEPARRAARGRRTDPGGAGGARPVRRPEEFPDDLDHVDMSVVPGGDHGFKVPKRGPISQEEAEGDRGRGDPGVDRPRGVGECSATRLSRVVPADARNDGPSAAPAVGWGTMTDDAADPDLDLGHDAPTPAEIDVPPRPTTSAPRASSATRCRSSTSSTRPRCG